mgnify:CR=1 FL=1
MGTALFSTLVNRLAANAPGAPQPVLVTHIRDAAIAACERTGAWRYEHATITVIAGTYEYSFVPESGAEVHTILTASINGVDLPTKTLEEIHELYPKWPSSVVAERTTPQYITQINPDTFHVALVPDNSTDTIEMFVAQKPLRDSTGMEDSVMDDIEDVIVHGALQGLLTMPETTWSDTELAAYHAKQFTFKVAERRARVNLGAGRATLTARPPVPFA